MRLANTDRSDPRRHRQRLVIDRTKNERSTVRLFGSQIGGGSKRAISWALDLLFNHPNLGPFIGRRLIQSLVTSNPSRDYVQRVSTIFANNGNGVRGDLKAVIRAILLDPEARLSPMPYAGRLRSPFERYLNVARAFGVYDHTDQWRNPDYMRYLRQSPGQSPSVFGFYRPSYSPPMTTIRRNGLLSPEFQLANEQTAVSYINFMVQFLEGRFGSFGLYPKFDQYREFADDSNSLVQELNLVLAAGQLSPEICHSISSALGTLKATEQNRDRRIRLASLLIVSSPAYLILE